jgi:hypothetical protein
VPDPYTSAYKTVAAILDKYLNELVGKNKPTHSEDDNLRVVMMFDESHYLLQDVVMNKERKTTGKDKGVKYSALLFRLIRIWLSKKQKGVRIVGIFTGTSGSLRNFHHLDPKPSETTDSCGFRDEYKFYPCGEQVFEEFYSLTTLGCLRFAKGPHEDGSLSRYVPNEYLQAIPYGRPLFVKMQAKDKLTAKLLQTVCRRMLMVTSSEWTLDDDRTAWMSILGTRFQIGQTSMDISSSLVAGGYANWVDVSAENTATICFGPDPVCAYLARGLMDEDWSIDLPTWGESVMTVQGRQKKWWVQKASDLFGKGLVRPEKGDFGEVMVAMFLILCCDEERKMLNHKKDNSGEVFITKYQTFSVQLDLVIARWANGGRRNASVSEILVAGEVLEQEAQSVAFFSISAIQVCRNYLRIYDHDWSALADQDFLENLYQAGVGFYTFPGCSTIDMVFALKCHCEDGQKEAVFYPMVVSVKARAAFGPGDVTKALKKMQQKAADAGWESGLCLLFLLGPDQSNKNKEQRLEAGAIKEMKRKKVACRVVYMPRDDEFEVYRSFTGTVDIKERPELLASHSFVRYHIPKTTTNKEDPSRKNQPPDFWRQCLRRRPYHESQDKNLILMEELAGVVVSDKSEICDEQKLKRELNQKQHKKRKK